jgi:hypothetical protein
MTVGGIATHGRGVLDDILNHCEPPEPAASDFLGIVSYYRAARLDKREDLDLQGPDYIVRNAEHEASDGSDSRAGADRMQADAVATSTIAEIAVGSNRSQRVRR